MSQSSSELNTIHLRRLATPGKKYYGDDEKIYVGTPDRRLKLEDKAIDTQFKPTSLIPELDVQRAIERLSTGSNIGSILTDTSTIDLTYSTAFPTSITADLKNTTVTAGVYGSTLLSPQITIDAQGRITAASNQVIAAVPAATVTIVNDVTTAAVMYPTWVTANSGSLPLKVSSTKLSFNPANTTTNGLILNNSTVTTGNAFSLQISGTQAGIGQTGLNIDMSGANASANMITYGLYSYNRHTGTNSTNYSGYFHAAGGSSGSTTTIGVYSTSDSADINYGGKFRATGFATTNIGLYLIASGATNNYGLLVQSGYVGINTLTPTSLFSIGASSEFQIDTTGNIIKLNNITTSFPAIQGTANSFLSNDGSGGLTWTATVNSTTSVVADAAGDTTTFVMLAGAATGNLPVLTDSALTYNAALNELTATTFIGNLTGNATTSSLSATTSLAAGFIGFGSAGNLLTGDSTFAWDNTNKNFTITGTIGQTLSNSVNVWYVAQGNVGYWFTGAASTGLLSHQGFGIDFKTNNKYTMGDVGITNNTHIEVNDTAQTITLTHGGLLTTGTIGSGLWNGTVISPVYGGTGVANNVASTLTISGSFATTLTVTAGTGVTLPVSGTLYGTLAGSITSAQLLSSISDETGTGVLVFGTAPTFTTSIITPIIYGGVAANDDITIEGTSHVTKATSYVNLQPSGGFVGVGLTSPLVTLHSQSITEQFRYGYDASNYVSHTTTSVGITTINPMGSASVFSIYGGNQVGSNIQLRATTANGTLTSPALRIYGGNNSGTTIAQWYNNGNMQLGTASLSTTDIILSISKNIENTGSGNSAGIYLNSVIQASTTANARMFISAPSTVASAFNVAALYHFQAANVSLGAGSTMTTQAALIFGDFSGATNNYGLYGVISAGTNKYNCYMSGTAQNYFEGKIGIGVAVPLSNLHVVQTAAATGVIKGLIYTGAVNTNQTLSTEIPSITLTTAGRQWATGAITTQREVLISAPTYTAVGASVITNASTLAISAAPIASTNITITNTYALWVQAGISQLDGNVKLGTAGTTIYIKEGANCAQGVTGVMVLGTIVVACTIITANSRINLTPIGNAVAQANAGSLSYALNAGVGFTIYSTNALDARTVSYRITEPS